MEQDTRRHILIGDVHGMLSELEALLEESLDLQPDDVLVFLGDLVDKGPKSAGVVRYVRRLKERGFEVRLVKGNHEDRHERYRRAVARSGGKVKMKGLDELETITAELSTLDIEFLQTAELSVKVPGGVAVHAGVLPIMESLDEAELGKAADQLMRVRHVSGRPKSRLTVEFTEIQSSRKYERDQVLSLADIQEMLKGEWKASVVSQHSRPEGSMISLGKETEEDPFWADVYDGRFGTVYFGHEPFLDATEPVEFPHAVGVDLGAVFGHRLAAVILDVGQAPRFQTVKASKRYSTAYFEES